MIDIEYLQQLKDKHAIIQEAVAQLNGQYSETLKEQVNGEIFQNQLSGINIADLKLLKQTLTELEYCEQRAETTDPDELAQIYDFLSRDVFLPEECKEVRAALEEQLDHERYQYIRGREAGFDFFLIPTDEKLFAMLSNKYVYNNYNEYFKILDKYGKREAITLAKYSEQEYYADLQQQFLTVENIDIFRNGLLTNYKSFSRLFLAKSALLPVFIAFADIQSVTFSDTDIFRLYQEAECNKLISLQKCADLFKENNIELFIEEIPLTTIEKRYFGQTSKIIEYLLQEITGETADIFMSECQNMYRIAIPLHLNEHLSKTVGELAAALLERPENYDVTFLYFCEKNFAASIRDFNHIKLNILLREAKSLQSRQIDNILRQEDEENMESLYYDVEINNICRELWQSPKEIMNSLKYVNIKDLQRIVQKICELYGDIDELHAWMAGYEFELDDSD